MISEPITSEALPIYAGLLADFHAKHGRDPSDDEHKALVTTAREMAAAGTDTKH